MDLRIPVTVSFRLYEQVCACSQRQRSALIDSISLISCVDELHQLPITSGVATGVANELSGVALATPGHPLESPLLLRITANPKAN